MKKTSILAAAAGLAIATGLASAQVFSASISQPIINTNLPLGTTNNTIVVAGGPTSISDLNVIFRTTHTFDADVDLILQGPAGFISLSTDNGGSGDNYSTTRFDDLAATSISSGAAPFNNNFRPEGTINGWAGSPATFTGTNFTNLAGFNGSDANGNWTLYAADDAGGDSGSWTYWSLEFNGSIDPQGPAAIGTPTNPSGVGSYTVSSIPSGGSTSLRLTVTPGTFPVSTSITASVDGSVLGLGTLTLLDDGINDDGVAGNNIFGRNSVIITGAPGAYTLPFGIRDGQGRSASGNMPALTLQAPPPSCPPSGQQAASFSNIVSFGPLNNASNAQVNLGWTGTDLIQDIHVSGRLAVVTAGTFASEARIQITFSDASTIVLQPFTQDGFAGATFLDIADYVFTLPTPRPVSSITNVQFFDSFDDSTPNADANWSTICLTWNPLLVPTNPAVSGSATPSSVAAGGSTQLRATASSGANPLSTGLGVTVDGSLIGAGTVTLLDDGVNDDGIAGNNVFGRSVTVSNSTAPGALSLPLTVTDDQTRSGSGSIALTIVPPAPACPEGSQPSSFTELASFDNFGAAGNARPSLGWTGSDLISAIHVSGRLSSATAGTFASEARIRITFADASSITLQPFTQAAFTGSLDVADYVFTLSTLQLVSNIASVELFESVDDATGAADSNWNNLCLSYDAQLTPTNPAVTASVTPTSGFPGTSLAFRATVTPGLNPTSSGLGVTVDGSLIGAGTVTLLDDGIADDGIAGNNIFGASASIGAAIPAGTYVLPLSVSDAQARTASANVSVSVLALGQWEESIQGGADAGDLPATAQIITGADGPFASIGGDLAANDVDMFEINICDPSTFSANLNDPRTNFDTQLWLFNSAGVGVAFNDDIATGSSRSFIDNSLVSAPGQYFLAINRFNRDALDADGALLWINTPFTGVRAPDGPGAANPVASWTGTTSAGTYLMSLTGVCIQNPVVCDPDVNQDGNADQGDIDYLIDVIAGGDNTTGIDPDFNQDGNSDQGDIDALVNVVAGGACP